MPAVELLVPFAALLEALLSDRRRAADLLAAPVPDGWPEHPIALEIMLRVLHEHPEEAVWHLSLFVDPALPAVVGSGGFKGPPRNGEVEIGYEVAPSFRNRGYATAAVDRLADRAFRSVDRVVAHTLPAMGPSVSVLRKAGFRRDGSSQDPELGEVWRWVLIR